MSKNEPNRQAWRNMIQRCYYERDKKYAFYGGKGVQVCDRWRESFENFLADMGPRPSPKHSLDRYPNGDGDYEPGNCRWATREEQRWNKKQRMLTANGRTQTLTEWCAETGLTKSAIMGRIQTLGWTVEDALGFGRKPMPHRDAVIRAGIIQKTRIREREMSSAGPEPGAGSSLAQRVRWLRCTRGLGPVEFSHLVGWSRAQVTSVEAYGRSRGLIRATAASAASALGISIDWLLTGEGSAYPMPATGTEGAQ